MKPIFEEERQFFYKRTGILLPEYSWRHINKIYPDCTCKKPLYTFKVINKQIKITKDNTEFYKDYKQKSIKELMLLYNDKINLIEIESINRTFTYLIQNPNHFYIISYSGGKDSTVLKNIWIKVLDRLKQEKQDIYNNLKWNYNFSNTSNETADTYLYIKKELPKDRLKILNPSIGFYPWITKVKNYFTPSVIVRNCCSTFKEGQLTKYYDKNQPLTTMTGVRKYESTKRAKYEFIMDVEWEKRIYGKIQMSKNWVHLAPIVEWHDEEVWLYILREKLSYNRQYDIGFNRCGCLICPYQSDYIDLLINEYYPNQWKRWMNILSKNYVLCHIKDNFKWTLEEWQNGKWKLGRSKEFEIINNKATPSRIKELADLKGITEKMANKYFNKRCKCGKKMNPTELAMFYKIFGRYEDVENDNRELLCKKCFCKEQNMNPKEYRSLVLRFTDEGCNLF